MKTIAAVGTILLAINTGLASTAQAKKSEPAKERVLIACPEPNHYVEIGWKKLLPPETACKTRPNVQPTNADLIWTFGKVDIDVAKERH